ncbi:aromatic acid exporter family protein [Cryobacterium sp. TMS1-13-1]|uniref:FUSC family protein n=1 Tax=Cryobacterium sp. TMS1-13-1 TaxID=1259220 RepID=UPI00106C56B7|nr:FUSC family protein [Cryobacterium sp. TMS1-13-1]TFD21309.1 FUSC family protein [Cryobacterium sp. TMS1-13-1]
MPRMIFPWNASRLASVRRRLQPPRFIQVAKIAVAVAIAWTLSPFLPGDAQELRYYAPLGALLSMHPTLMRSLRSALQTLAGLAVGIALAGAVLLLSEPSVWTISLVMGFGSLIGGMRWLGVGGEQVPLTALFVLIIGGPEADGYTAGYLAQVCLGIMVGLLVNLLILPPLAVGTAVERLTSFRGTLATHLSDIGVALVESWPPERELWATRDNALSDAARDVRSAVQYADESRKGNPRARFNRRNLVVDYEDLAALENVTFHVRNLTEVFAGMIWGKPIPLELPPALRPVLSDALHAVAETLRATDDGPRDSAPFDNAVAAVEAILHGMQELGAGATSLSPTAAIVIDLKRILVALRPGTERDSEGSPSPVV